MKVYDIISEKRIDEAIPLLALGAIPMVLSAIAAGMKAMTIYDLYNTLAKNGYDIDNMSDDDKLGLFINFIILFVPGGGKFTNAVLMKMLPDRVKRRGIKMVGDFLKPKAEELRKMKNLNRKNAAATRSTDPVQAAKGQKDLLKQNKKLDSQYQAIGKQLAAEKLKNVAYTVVGSVAALPLAYTYYGKLDELDQQYTAHKGGDKTTALFGEMDDNQAWEQYQSLRNKYIGELTIGITAALSRTPIVKKLDAFNKIVGKVTGAVGGKIVGGLFKLPIGVVTKLAKVGGPALTILMQTEEGQKFLSNTIIELITKGVGALTSGTINFLAAAIDKALASVGVDSNIKGAVQGQPPSPNVQNTDELEKKYNKPNTPRDLYVTFDPKNNKVIYMGGIKMTDEQGFLVPGTEQRVNNLDVLAKRLGHPNPIQTLNLKFR
jgi:hypothetical protein